MPMLKPLNETSDCSSTDVKPSFQSPRQLSSKHNRETGLKKTQYLILNTTLSSASKRLTTSKKKTISWWKIAQDCWEKLKEKNKRKMTKKTNLSCKSLISKRNSRIRLHRWFNKFKICVLNFSRTKTNSKMTCKSKKNYWKSLNKN